MRTTDSLGRSFPNQLIPLDKRIVLGEEDIYGILEPVNTHGPLFTPYLEDFQSFYRKTGLYSCKRTSWLARSKCVEYEGTIGGPVLIRPADQFPQTGQQFSRNMTLYYDLTPRGIEVLKRESRYHPIKHGGWRGHQLSNGCVTASLHLGMLDDGVVFKPPDQITDTLGHIVPYELRGDDGKTHYYDRHRLVPDYLFEARYNTTQSRYFVVETDLNNEVGEADPEKTHARKTLERMILQYLAFIGDGTYHDAYGIPDKKGLMLLIVTTGSTDRIKRIIEKHVRKCNYIGIQRVPKEAFSPYHSPRPIDLWTTPWERAGQPDFYINNPERQ